MRVFYLAMGCLMLGLCAMSRNLPVSHGQEPVDVEYVDELKPLTPAEFEQLKKDIKANPGAVFHAYEGKKPKPDRPDRHDKHKPVLPTPAPDPVDPLIDVVPQPIPPRPKPHVLPQPNNERKPNVKPHIHIPVIPDVVPHVPEVGWLKWFLKWLRTIVAILVLGIVAIVALVAWYVFRPRI